MISRALVDQILLGPGVDLRFTQDSPVLPEVWSVFAADPEAPVEVLITPYKDMSAGSVAVELEKALASVKQTGARTQRLPVAYLDGVVAARLTFGGLVRTVLPRTKWWKDSLKFLPDASQGDEDARAFVRGMLGMVLRDSELAAPIGKLNLPSDLARVMTLISLIEVAERRRSVARQSTGRQATGKQSRNLAKRRASVEESLNHASSRKEVVEDACNALVELLRYWNSNCRGAGEPPTNVWLVTLNRPAYPAIRQSVSAIKADAALKLFNVDCSRVCWAIIDSGIDANHPAFMESKGGTTQSRVLEVFDFTMLRAILNVGQSGEEFHAELAHQIQAQSGFPAQRIRARLQAIARDREEGRPIDWKQLEPLLRRSHDTPPYSDHGTHVAGILAANWKDRKEGDGKPWRTWSVSARTSGLYDLRVLCETVEESEFAVIGALQFIRFLNERNGYMMIHGANLEPLDSA